MKFKLKGICVEICGDTPSYKLKQLDTLCKKELKQELKLSKRYFILWLRKSINHELQERQIQKLILTN
jgi:hypothetical protein